MGEPLLRTVTMSPANTAELDTLGRELQALIQNPDTSAETWLALGRRFYAVNRLAETLELAGLATARRPDAPDLWNLKGVALRMQKRLDEALAALDTALAIDPDLVSALVNRGNVLMDLGRIDVAVTALERAVSLEPGNAAAHNRLARALLQASRADAAIDSFRAYARLQPTTPQAWVQLAAVLSQLRPPEEAEAALLQGLAVNPDAPPIVHQLVLGWRSTGQHARAAKFLADILQRRPDDALVNFHLGDLLRETAPAQALHHLRRAIALSPDNTDFTFGLIQALEAQSTGPLGGDVLDEGHALACRALAQATLAEVTLIGARIAVLHATFSRVGAWAQLDELDTLRTKTAPGVLAGDLFPQIARARTPAQQAALMRQHQLWGQGAAAAAARAPLPPRPARPPAGRLRLGFLSSDLRAHPVGYFALPLFQHVDDARFELFVYSHHAGEPDAVRTLIASRTTRYNVWPRMTARDTAARIAADDLDMLIELGGHTTHNRPEVLAYRPAPIQASYLGYPHSLGLDAVDLFICDPRNQPSDPSRLAETPLVMPQSWIALSDHHRARYGQVETVQPADRRGVITFATANSPQKYTPEAIEAWACVLKAVPQSRFRFLRPEVASSVLRRNMVDAFSRSGVPPERIEWCDQVGASCDYYADVDISLDTFPLTGGTTTVDSLMMGVPVVTLRGQAFHERLSASILANVALGDLVADDLDGYVNAAVALALDRDRLRTLRAGLRNRVLDGPLGQTEVFARDFYDMIHTTVTAARASPRTGD